MSTIPGDKVWALLESRPSLYRGGLVEVRGNVVRADTGEDPLKLRALPGVPNVGTDRVYRSYMIDEDKVHGIFHHYLVYTVEDQRDELQHLDGVVLRGYFCRLYRGEVNHKGQILQRDIPVLVAGRYEKLPELESTGVGVLGLIPWVLGIVGFGAVLIWLILRRSDSAYRGRLKAARAEARARVQRGEDRSAS